MANRNRLKREETEEISIRFNLEFLSSSALQFHRVRLTETQRKELFPRLITSSSRLTWALLWLRPLSTDTCHGFPATPPFLIKFLFCLHFFGRARCSETFFHSLFSSIMIQSRGLNCKWKTNSEPFKRFKRSPRCRFREIIAVNLPALRTRLSHTKREFPRQHSPEEGVKRSGKAT